MGRPPKREDDDLDIYNEAALNLDNVEQAGDSPENAESDEMLQELGEATPHERLSSLNEEGGYENGQE